MALKDNFIFEPFKDMWTESLIKYMYMVLDVRDEDKEMHIKINYKLLQCFIFCLVLLFL